jgi:D-cysteine desulfhydrase family pyridoxal phosphate-dependent enzyme
MNSDSHKKKLKLSALYQHLPRQTLGFLPTPLCSLLNISRLMDGPTVYIKRDDQTGLALGGNKTRKLEFLLGDALALGCDTLITGGAAQSNHCRQTAAAAALCGLSCHLMLGGDAPEQVSGNLLLDELLGATVHFCGESRKGEGIPALVAKLQTQGHKPYVIPYGGSNSLGAMGYVAAFAELLAQCEAQDLKLSKLIFASSSGGTHAGLLLAKLLSGSDIDIIGINIEKPEITGVPFAKHIVNLVKQGAALLGQTVNVDESDVVLRDEYVGEGYGIVGAPEREAISVLAKNEGILLDPVYTGKAMAGLLAMLRAKEFSADENIVFLHTGGAPALFPYANDLT